MNNTLTVILLVALPFFAFGMGGDKPGPHKGYITMPGTYHVELVPTKNSFEVFLLDIAMKNPTTTNSNISFKLIGTKNQFLTCAPKSNFFLCTNLSAPLKDFNEIQISSTRNGIKGNLAVYKLPLRFQ